MPDNIATLAYANRVHTQSNKPDSYNNEQTILFLLIDKNILLKIQNKKYILLQHFEHLNRAVAHAEILALQHHSDPCAHRCTESFEQIFIPTIVPRTKTSFHKGQRANLIHLCFSLYQQQCKK